MSYRTFEEWKARGRVVNKGEKAMGHLNDGSALFGKEQTKKLSSKSTWRGLGDQPDSWYMGDPLDYN